jgi:adenylate cyclase
LGNFGRRTRLTFLLVIGTVLASAVVASQLSALPLLQLFDLKTYDLRRVLLGRESPPPDIVLVTIDDRTEQAIREPRIFWHPYYSALLRALSEAGARAIGLDVSFGMSVAKWEPDFDRELAETFTEVSAVTPVVLAYDNLQPAPEGIPLYILANALGATGFANLTLDRDSFVRRQELRTHDSPGLEAFSARLYTLTTSREDTGAPLDVSGSVFIHYWGPGGTFPSFSMAEVLAAAKNKNSLQLERWFHNKIVLVGSLDATDKRPTPFYLAAGGQDLMPGLEIHANILDTLIQHRYVRRISQVASTALIVGAAILAALFIFKIPFPWAPSLLIVAVIAYFAISVAALRAGKVLPVIPPILSMFLSGLGSYGAYSMTEGRRKRLLQNVLGRYVSKEIADEVLAGGDFEMGGTQRLVTVMFSDLRNFTTYCHGRDPKLVVDDLNEYFRDMSAEIKAHGGMVNQFIGDGILALFGVPVAHGDDVQRAVACAIQMVRRNTEFNTTRGERGLPPLIIGIGIHTGEAVVGNIGSSDKIAYTAIGDTVNIASRIESENKTYNSQLLVSEATYEYVKDHVACELAGHSHLKGIAEPMRLFRISAMKESERCFQEP